MSESLSAFSYSGEELEVFARAVNWKAYWSRQIEPYLGHCILELGAGLGATALALNHVACDRWLGMEPDETMYRLIAGRLTQSRFPDGYQIRHGTSANLRDTERFDTILYIDVLEHIQDDREELTRVSRHLDVGGHIVIVAPAHNFLYTPFDRKIGHHRRYDKRLLTGIVPSGMSIRRMYYLDSVGMLASLANRLVLKSDTPTEAQIRLWDSVMIRASRWIDPLTFHRFGKSIVCVLQKAP